MKIDLIIINILLLFFTFNIIIRNTLEVPRHKMFEHHCNGRKESQRGLQTNT